MNDSQTNSTPFFRLYALLGATLAILSAPWAAHSQPVTIPTSNFLPAPTCLSNVKAKYDEGTPDSTTNQILGGLNGLCRVKSLDTGNIRTAIFTVFYTTDERNRSAIMNEEEVSNVLSPVIMGKAIKANGKSHNLWPSIHNIILDDSTFTFNFLREGQYSLKDGSQLPSKTFEFKSMSQLGYSRGIREITFVYINGTPLVAMREQIVQGDMVGQTDKKRISYKLTSLDFGGVKIAEIPRKQSEGSTLAAIP